MTIRAAIRVKPDNVIGEIHDYLYGTNLEQIGESIYGGIWAEMLKSPKFSGPDRKFMSMAHGGELNPHHGVVSPWESVNPDYQKVIFDHDFSHVYVRPRYQTDSAIHKGIHPPSGTRTVWTGQQSQRITIREDDGRPHGISQGKLNLKAGHSYRLRLVLKGEGQDVQVTLGNQSWTVPAVDQDWQTYHHNFRPTRDENSGELAITFHGLGTLWVARASLMPADNLDGFRKDVVESIKTNWTPTFIRWPGGNFASAYHWMDGVDDIDKRPPYLDPAWQQWEYHDVGTDEFIKFCHLVDSEPILTVNMGTGTPEEAAAWVEYCNGSPDTKYGAMRANNGQSKPFNIKTWFVGNEQYGNWQDGHCDAETYAHHYQTFAQAMRQVDPDLLLLAVGVPTDQFGHWNERVLSIAADEMDMLSMHWYSMRTMRRDNPPPAAEVVLPQLAAAHEIDFILHKTLEIIAEHSDPPVALAFDEWNTYIRAKPPLFLEEYNVADALYTGGLMNACIRLCDRIKMSASFNFINVMGNYRVTPRAVWQTPATLVLDLFTRFRGPLGIDCQVTETPTFNSPEIGQQFAYNDVPTVDAAATYDPELGFVYLSVVNHDQEQAADIIVGGIPQIAGAKVYQISGEQGTELNTEEEPSAVTLQQSILTENANILQVPPLSFSMVVVKAR